MRIDLTGKVFGRWTALKWGRKKVGPIWRSFWVCRCACGTIAEVSIGHLRNGASKSCGCGVFAKHRLCGSPEYIAWRHMRDRCSNPKSQMWRWYGARGIKVCSRWADSFEAFYADVGPRPSSKHSIDRIDNDGNYEPENVKWSIREQQDNNRRDCKYFEFRGERLTIAQWARRTGLAFSTIRARLRRWGPERALTTPLYEAYSRMRQQRRQSSDGCKS